jgi:Xaa-Pro aminopeptidase
MGRRHRFVQDLMAGRGLQAVVVGGPTGPLETAVQYFSNWPSQVQSYVVFRPDTAPVLLVRLWNHLPDAERISVVADVRYGGDTPADQVDALARLLSGVGRVGLIGVVPHGDLLRLRHLVAETAIVDCDDDYRAFRLVKSAEEMVFVRIASRMNDAAVSALAAALRPGMREPEVAEVIEGTYLAHRAWNLIHFSLSTPMEDPAVCVPHQYHPDRMLRAGDVFVTEISTTFWGYAGQILRTFTIGAPPTDRYRRLHEVALDVYHRIVERLRPGTTVGDVLDVADRITDAGFDIWDDLVHGFGGAYLPPIVRTRASRGATHPDDHPYPDGALVVVQPNVIDGAAGVQVGNSVWISSGGVEITQQYPTRLIECDNG